MLQSHVSVNKVVFYLKLQQEIMIRIVLNFDRYKYIINPTFSNGAGSSLSLLYCSGFSVKRDRYFFLSAPDFICVALVCIKGSSQKVVVIFNFPFLIVINYHSIR